MTRWPAIFIHILTMCIFFLPPSDLTFSLFSWFGFCGTICMIGFSDVSTMLRQQVVSIQYHTTDRFYEDTEWKKSLIHRYLPFCDKIYDFCWLVGYLFGKHIFFIARSILPDLRSLFVWLPWALSPSYADFCGFYRLKQPKSALVCYIF